MLDISKIKIDELTQSRVELNQDIVAEYAQAMLDGAEFPAVTVFFDGSDFWLADGYHRYFAAKKAGKELLFESITPGSKRDAILFSAGANATHGLPRTNADKRKAIMLMLNDAEWCKLSDREIAKTCKVHHSTVSDYRRSLSETDSDDQKTTERTYTTKHGTQATMQVSNIGKNPTTPPQNTQLLDQSTDEEPQAEIEPEPERAGADEDEIYSLMQEMQQELEQLRKIVEADDRLKAANDEITRLKAVERVLQSRINGLMGEKDAAIKQAKTYQRQIDRLKKEQAHV